MVSPCLDIKLTKKKITKKKKFVKFFGSYRKFKVIDRKQILWNEKSNQVLNRNVNKTRKIPVIHRRHNQGLNFDIQLKLRGLRE